MNKEEIIRVLEATLLWVDQEEPEIHGIEPKLAKIGKKLTNYLEELQ
ncbi:MAG: hypothetical protein WC796_01945 [Candidatus Pacearchaeota archaeon]|jgi:hypothetical protein